MAVKEMPLRFTGTCATCKGRIPAGERAYWQRADKATGTRSRVWHPACYDMSDEYPPTPVPGGNPAGEVPQVKPVPAGTRFVDLEFSDVRQVWDEIMRGEYSALPVNRERGEQFHSRWNGNDQWSGCSGEDMKSWLRDGFHVPGMEAAPGLVRTRARRKLRFTDMDGELDVDLVKLGYDYPFREWESREGKPGLTVEIDCAFSAFVKPEVIADYGRWVARAIYTLESAGYALEINFTIRTRGTFQGEATTKRTDIRIRVKEMLRNHDFTSYSALFSPGGFRMLGFTAMLLAAEKVSKRITSGLGSPVHHDQWGAAWSKENRTLSFHHSTREAKVFPQATLTAQLSALLPTLST